MRLRWITTAIARSLVMVAPCIALLFTFACGSAQRRWLPPERPGAQPALSRQERAATLAEVWQTINDHYYDLHFNGVDWQAVRERYRPRVEAAAGDAEFYRHLEEMLAELRDAHTVFVAPQRTSSLQPGGSVGISLGEAEGKTVITEVDPASDAARAGVQPGMLLRTVNGGSVAQLYAEIRANFTGSSSPQAMQELMRSALLYGGFLGAARTFGIENFDGRVFEVAIKQRSPRPASPALTARRLPSGFGYIKFDSWQPPIDERFGAELAKLMKTPGLIIDLRGNGGGAQPVLLNIASHFFANESNTGSFRARDGTVTVYFTHRPERAYTAPLAILVDEVSASASETFAQFMQESGRAIIVGRQTCGCALNSHTKRTPDGGTLRYSARVYRSPQGRVIEGRGVVPDATVPLTIADLRRGRDAALETAEDKLNSPALREPKRGGRE